MASSRVTYSRLIGVAGALLVVGSLVVAAEEAGAGDGPTPQDDDYRQLPPFLLRPEPKVLKPYGEVTDLPNHPLSLMLMFSGQHHWLVQCVNATGPNNFESTVNELAGLLIHRVKVATYQCDAPPPELNGKQRESLSKLFNLDRRHPKAIERGPMRLPWGFVVRAGNREPEPMGPRYWMNASQFNLTQFRDLVIQTTNYATSTVEESADLNDCAAYKVCIVLFASSHRRAQMLLRHSIDVYQHAYHLYAFRVIDTSNYAVHSRELLDASVFTEENVARKDYSLINPDGGYDESNIETTVDHRKREDILADRMLPGNQFAHDTIAVARRYEGILVLMQPGLTKEQRQRVKDFKDRIKANPDGKGNVMSRRQGEVQRIAWTLFTPSDHWVLGKHVALIGNLTMKLELQKEDDPLLELQDLDQATWTNWTQNLTVYRTEIMEPMEVYATTADAHRANPMGTGGESLLEGLAARRRQERRELARQGKAPGRVLSEEESAAGDVRQEEVAAESSRVHKASMEQMIKEAEEAGNLDLGNKKKKDRGTVHDFMKSRMKDREDEEDDDVEL